MTEIALIPIVGDYGCPSPRFLSIRIATEYFILKPKLLGPLSMIYTITYPIITSDYSAI